MLTIDRPERLNATDEPLHTELATVWRDVDRDEDARVAVVTGAGRAFSAGGDLEMIQGMSGDYRRVAAMAGEAASLVTDMLECEKPIISVINGPAGGRAGLAVALMADISSSPRTPDSPTGICDSAWSPATTRRSSGRSYAEWRRPTTVC